MTTRYSVTFDYRCPFARNAHEAVVSALRAGADHDVRFVPFSLDQIRVEEGEPPLWARPESERGTGLLALQWGVAVRDNFPDQFLDFHLGAFAARHDAGRQLKEETVLRDVAYASDLDPDVVAELVAGGEPLEVIAAEHTEMVEEHAVFGVPTFVAHGEAAFIRFMECNRADDLQRALGLLDWSRLNEFKRTRIPR